MFTLPDLPYAYDALEPVISKKIMELHHDKHHAGYVKKANAALENTEWAQKSVEEILEQIDKLPEEIQTPVKNNAGGHANHSFFWSIMRAPQTDNPPPDSVREKLDETFGNFDVFKTTFSETAANQFGSGWGWLVKTSDGELSVYSTPNQDSPLMKGDTPILGIDIWEHAYYLDYLNERPKYIETWWQVVNWEKVEQLLTN